MLIALIAIVLLLRGQGHPDQAPPVSVALLDGGTVDFARPDGKVRLVEFWSTSCVPCVRGMPKLAEVHRKFESRGFEVVAVAMSYDAPDQVQAFAEREKLPFRVGFDPVGDIDRGFGGIRATPTSFLVDRTGRIVERVVGNPGKSKLEASIEALLAPAS